jgi:hypothetical protein
MSECEGCKKAFECFMSNLDPCKRVVKWEDLDQKYYLKKYESKGLGMNLFWRKDKK